jgi:hypothetical protein
VAHPEIDPALERVVLAALSKSPRARPSSAGALLRAVREQRASLWERGVAVVRQRPYWMLMPLLVLVVGLSAVLILRSFGGDATPTPEPVTVTPTVAVTPSATPTPSPTVPVTLSPTPTVGPTSTPNPQTPSPTVAVDLTPSPPPAGPPVLIAPEAGVQVQQTLVRFTWQGQIGSGVRYVVRARHVESGRVVECLPESPDATMCVVDLPGDLFGEWRWLVAVEPGGPRSAEERVLWLKTF